MREHKKITICADDFGQNPAVTAGVLQLLKCGKINATSCLVNSKYWEASAVELKQIYNDKMQVGLHLNLTEGKPLTDTKCLKRDGAFMGLNPLLIKAFTCRLKSQQIYQELKAQLQKFISVWGQNPDFIDGHQHIHHLPVVRKVLMQLYKEFGLATSQTWVRSVSNMAGVSGLKPKIIVGTGAKKLEKLLKQNDIPHNTTFSGAYDFNPENDFAETFGKALAAITDRGLIMCHPGEASDRYPDSLSHSRPKELAYFMSNKFSEQMKEAASILGSGNI
ncbi:ChbG/HpnK family deacetylase [Francisellaceae bacterium]|nr:ChbG/HpnK family deacetylase [Francisellaceae bacterium]